MRGRRSRYNGPIISPKFHSMFEVFLSRVALVSATLVAAVLLSACAGSSATKSVVGVFTPYRFDRVQGNVVTREQIDALKPGMNKTQVKEILGTPMVTSMFRSDRWDYPFTFYRQGVEPQLRRVTVYFTDDLLTRFDAGDVPGEAQFVASLKPPKPLDKLPALEAAPERLAAFDPPTPLVPTVLPPPAADYPPLEAAQ